MWFIYFEFGTKNRIFLKMSEGVASPPVPPPPPPMANFNIAPVALNDNRFHLLADIRNGATLKKTSAAMLNGTGISTKNVKNSRTFTHFYFNILHASDRNFNQFVWFWIISIYFIFFFFFHFPFVLCISKICSCACRYHRAI